MNQGFSRKSTPKVKDGKVQRKNRWEQSPNYYIKDRASLLIERRKPGKGFRHLLTRDDLEAFIALIPEWPELSRGLNAIVLDSGDFDTDGYHAPGVLHICAWEEELWVDLSAEGFNAHSALFDRLGVPAQELEPDLIRCFFSEENAKAYQLLHIFLHELGHHRDRMTSKKKERTTRGEKFAENFAFEYEKLIFPRYVERFQPTFARNK